MKNYYKTKNDFYSSTLEDKIDTLLYTNAKCLEQYLNTLIINKTRFSMNDIKERNINIGALLSGEVYYKEKNKHYEIFGFMVETEMIVNNKRKVSYGFRGIYFNSDDELSPINFDLARNLDDTDRIENGLGDYVELDEEIIQKRDVQKLIIDNNIDINKYLKELNLFLEEKTKHKEMENAL